MNTIILLTLVATAGLFLAVGIVDLLDKHSTEGAIEIGCALGISLLMNLATTPADWQPIREWIITQWLTITITAALAAAAFTCETTIRRHRRAAQPDDIAHRDGATP